MGVVDRLLDNRHRVYTAILHLSDTSQLPHDQNVLVVSSVRKVLVFQESWYGHNKCAYYTHTLSLSL
jgi:hypothetical protein